MTDTILAKLAALKATPQDENQIEPITRECPKVRRTTVTKIVRLC